MSFTEVRFHSAEGKTEQSARDKAVVNFTKWAAGLGGKAADVSHTIVGVGTTGKTRGLMGALKPKSRLVVTVETTYTLL